MLSQLTLKFGRSPDSVITGVDLTPVTVFVGPNNSGKSKVLSEIANYCRTGLQDLQDVIVGAISFRAVPASEVRSHIDRIRLTPRLGEVLNVGNVLVGKYAGRTQVPEPQLEAALQSPNSMPNQFGSWYLGHSTLILGGETRITLVREQSAGDLQAPPQNSFQALFANDARRAEVRRILHDAFGSYFVLDPTKSGYLRARLSLTAPSNPMVERGIHQEAVNFHAAAQPIEFASDGVKAFTGIVTEIIAGDPLVILLDEPEAFLHPALAFTLGKELARATLGSEKRLFVSTHSPNFVMGCIQSGAPVNIVRLTYRDTVATARLLKNADILKLMRNPLLRSTGVLGGLFYEFVVVTESDTDRAFYQEINERLLLLKPEWGIPNCLFINAQNKQTVHTIIRPLRELGIPAAAIVDVDVIKDGGTTWSNLLSGAYVPGMLVSPLSQIRSAVKAACENSGKDMKRDGGTAILAQGDAEAANSFFDQLDAYGVFAVRRGELESWLRSLGAPGKGPSWLIDVFERMGEDPDGGNYTRPTDNDVWSFIGGVKKWLADPLRKGIPS